MHAKKVTILTLNFFLLLTSYYLVKPVRESLILSSEGGAVIKSYAGAFQALLFIVLIPLYSKLADKFDKKRLVAFIYLFMALNLFIFAFLQKAGAIHLGVIFFLWVGIFNLVVISQTWSLCNDLFTVYEGKRFFPTIMLGANLGAIAGSLVVTPLISGCGLITLMLASAAILIFCALVVNFGGLFKIPASVLNTGEHSTGSVPQKNGDAGFSGITLVFKNKYILLVAFLILTINVVNTNSEYMMGSMVSAWAIEKASASGALNAGELIGMFYGKMYMWVSILVLVLQLAVVRVIISKFNIKVALLAVPVLALASYMGFIFLPVLALLKIIKIAENGASYSLNNTAKEVLFLPLLPHEKYKAKFTVDTLFTRLGDAVSGLFVWIFPVCFSLGLGGFAKVNIILVLLWVYLVFKISKKYKAMIVKQ